MSFSGFSNNPVNDTVSNDGFFPDQNLATFQAVYRLPAEYNVETVIDGLNQAIIWTNDQLDEWRQVQEAAGYNTLLDVPASQLGTDSRYTLLYSRAVGCYAKAILLRQFYTIERRPAANNDAKESQESEDIFYEYADAAIADFLGAPRITVYSL